MPQPPIVTTSVLLITGLGSSAVWWLDLLGLHHSSNATVAATAPSWMLEPPESEGAFSEAGDIASEACPSLPILVLVASVVEIIVSWIVLCTWCRLRRGDRKASASSRRYLQFAVCGGLLSLACAAFASWWFDLIDHLTAPFPHGLALLELWADLESEQPEAYIKLCVVSFLAIFLYGSCFAWSRSLSQDPSASLVVDQGDEDIAWLHSLEEEKEDRIARDEEIAWLYSLADEEDVQDGAEVPQAIAEAETQSRTEEEARAKAQEEAKIKAEHEARAQAEAKVDEEARAKAEAEAKINAEQEAKVKVVEDAWAQIAKEAKMEAEESVRAIAEEEAQARAEEEARNNIEEDARTKAEYEAQAKAEEEAQTLAKEQAKAKAVEKARAKAETEARIITEEETKIKAEDEARSRIEEEAKKAAEETVKAIAEEEAQARAEEESRINAEKEAKTKAENEAWAQAEEEAQAVAKEQAKAKADEKARARAETEARINAEQEAKLKAGDETWKQIAKETKMEAEESVKAIAEEEAQARAEEEARNNAEEEAKIKAKNEARAKAEEEAQTVTKEQAKAKADEEARARAEEDARVNVEEEAKIKAEYEARAKMEEEAQTAAEKEAQTVEENAKAVAEEAHAIAEQESAFTNADEDEHLRAEQLWFQTQDEVFRQAQVLAEEEAQRQEEFEATQRQKEEGEEARAKAADEEEARNNADEKEEAMHRVEEVVEAVNDVLRMENSHLAKSLRIGYIGSPANLQNDTISEILQALVKKLQRMGHQLYVGPPNSALEHDGVKVQDMNNAAVNMFDIVLITPGGPGALKEARRFEGHARLFTFMNSSDERFGSPPWMKDLTSARTFDFQAMVGRKNVGTEEARKKAEEEEPVQQQAELEMPNNLREGVGTWTAAPRKPSLPQSLAHSETEYMDERPSDDFADSEAMRTLSGAPTWIAFQKQMSSTDLSTEDMSAMYEKVKGLVNRKVDKENRDGVRHEFLSVLREYNVHSACEPVNKTWAELQKILSETKSPHSA